MAGSGIFSTWGFAQETTWGTYAAPTNWLTYNSHTMQAKKTPLQAQALHGGIYNLAKRRSIGKWSADGSVSLDMYDRGLGLLFKHMLGAGTSALDGSSTTAYKQIFTPADTTGESLTMQIGVPLTNSSVDAISYEGSKVTDWTIEIKAGDLATFEVGFDALKEDTTQSYVAPSYTSGQIFVAAQASLILGGTVTTTGGVTSISGGTVIPLAKSASIKGTNTIDQSRYVLGSYYKQEQLINGFRSITGTVDLDFNGYTQTYNAFASDTQVSLWIKFVGETIDSTNNINAEVDILLPALFWDEDKFPVPGPQVVQESVTFTVLDDGVDNPMQINYITLDSSIE